MIENYTMIRGELDAWDALKSAEEERIDREELIVFSKIDLIDGEHLEEMKRIFEKTTGKTVMMTLSAGAHMNIEALKDVLITRIPEVVHEITEESKIKKYHLNERSDPRQYMLERREDGDFVVSGKRIEEIARMTDTRYTDGVGRVYDVMEKLGIMRKIKQILTDDLANGMNTGFFEGEDDLSVPNVWIGEKSFSLDGIVFMREKN